jgi:flagellar protein FliO/FliZ
MNTAVARRILPALVLNMYAASVFGNSDAASGADDGGSIVSLVVPLVVILGAAGAAAWFLRRWKGSLGRREGPMQLLHVIALGPRERLALVKVGSRHLVIGVTPTSVSRVAEVSESTDSLLDDRPGSGSSPAAATPPSVATPGMT